MSWWSRLFGKSAAQGPFTEAFKAWASARRSDGDWWEAKRLFRSALAKSPDSWVGHFGLGGVLSDEERAAVNNTLRKPKPRRPSAESVQSLRKALELNPAAAEAHLLLTVQFAASDPATAASHFAAATSPAARMDESIYPRSRQADDYWEAAVGFAGGGRRELAVAAFRRAIELNPRFADQTPDGAMAADCFADAAYDLLPGREAFSEEEAQLWRLLLRKDRQGLRRAGVEGATFVARWVRKRFYDLPVELLEVGAAVAPEAVVELGCLKSDASEKTAGDTFIAAVGQAGDPRAVGPLVAIINGRPTGQSNYGNWRLKSVAAALGTVGDAQAVKPLVGLLDPNERNDSNSVSNVAAKSLEAILHRHARVLPDECLVELANLSHTVQNEVCTAESGRDDEFTSSVDWGVDVGQVKQLAADEIARRRNQPGNGA